LGKSINFFFICILAISFFSIVEIIDINAQTKAGVQDSSELNKIPELFGNTRAVLDNDFKVEKFVDGLHVPTAIEFLDDDLLVLQKNDGKVKLIRDGVLQSEPVLDVEVSNYGEQGLLGITSQDSTVYLFFTEAYHDGGLPLGNHIYAYTWNGEKLIEPRLVKKIPAQSPSYNGGALITDLEKNVYASSGYQYKFGQIQNQLSSESYHCKKNALMGDCLDGFRAYTFSENMKDTLSCISVSFRHHTANPFSYQDQQPDLSETPWETNPAFILGNIQSCLKNFMYNNSSNGNWEDVGVILQVEPSDDYIAIGVRNSFGLAVDPMTGNLWMTENGPDQYDEINLLSKKSNLGWSKHVGPVDVNTVSPIDGFEEYTYRNPEFSWQLPIGLTGLSFADSEMFKKYSNWLFVSDSITGNIYKFELNAERTGFKFSDPNLQDLVVDIDPENKSGYLHESMDEILFATNFGLVTDLEFGPDGSLYIVSLINGDIHRILLK